MYSKSVYDVWQEITISSYSTNTLFLTVHNILHPTPIPTARRHRTTGDIPGTCVKLFDCWRLLNNESIPIPSKYAKEFSRMFPLFLTFSSIPTTIMGPLFPVVESFQTHILSPSLFYKTIHSHFQMAPICSAHSTSLGCSSIPFIVHLIDLNHLHYSSLLFWTVLNTHTTTFTYFQPLSFQQHDIQPITNIRHTQYTSP